MVSPLPGACLAQGPGVVHARGGAQLLRTCGEGKACTCLLYYIRTRQCAARRFSSADCLRGGPASVVMPPAGRVLEATAATAHAKYTGVPPIRGDSLLFSLQLGSCSRRRNNHAHWDLD